MIDVPLKRFRFIGAALLALPGFSWAEAELRVHCRGEGPAVYLIGGGPAFTTRHLQPVQARLAERYRVCRWDMRGVGDNAEVPLRPGESVLAQWLEDMGEVLPREPVVLWGHSWGALQALQFAARHPQRVRGLVLSNPVDPALRSLDGIEHKRMRHASPEGELELDELGTPVEELHNLRSKLASYFLDAERGWAFARRFTPADTNGHLNVRVWDEYRAAPLSAAAVHIQAPKISGLIHCREDVLQPEALWEYRRLLPHHQHVVLRDCAHFPWEEQPQAYYDGLLAALEAAWR